MLAWEMQDLRLARPESRQNRHKLPWNTLFPWFFSRGHVLCHLFGGGSQIGPESEVRHVGSTNAS
jgi:hypothetical protein